MDNKKRFEGIQQREVDYENCGLRVLDEEQRTIELSFSSETPVMRFGAYEVLSHKRDAVILERINKTGCLLFNHNRDKILGKILKAEIKNKRGIATVQFDDDEESIKFFEKVKNGSLRNTSVGYIVHEMERKQTGRGESSKVIYTATSWEPIEISLVSVPADITVGIGRSMQRLDKPSSLKLKKYQLIINENLLRRM